MTSTDFGWLIEQVEGALHQASRRGMSPAAAARRVRHTSRADCTAGDARHALVWLTGQQRTHTLRHQPGRYLPGRAR